MADQHDYLQFLQDSSASKVWWKDSLFLMALALAVVLHLALISIRFIEGRAAPMTTKDVTIAIHLTQDKIKAADFEAQADQQGDGDLKNPHRQTTPLPVNADDGEMGEQQQQQTPHQPQMQSQQLDVQQRMLMTTLSWQKQSQDEKRQKAVMQQQNQDQTRRAMIASLEAQYAQRQQMYAKKQNIQTLTGVLAKSNPSAAYIHRFQQKVEMFGNRYYPDSAKQQKLSGDVRLMVVLTPEGEIRAIRLLQSSGHLVLDEAAKDSVRRAVPFGRFDPAMKDIHELRIVRTWRFDAQDSIFDVGE